MKVLLAVDEYPPNIWGGMGKSAHLLAESLLNSGVDISVLTVNRINKDIIEDSFRKIKVYRVPKSKEKGFLFTYILSDKPDILHINGRHYGRCIHMLQQETTKIIYTSRSNFLEEVRAGSLRFNKKKAQNQESLLKIADYVVTTSHDEGKSLIADYPWIKNRLHVILNGISLKQDTPITLSKKLRIIKSKEIFFAGRFVKQKGIDTLLKLLPKILTENPEASVIVAGGHGKIFYERKLTELLNKYPKLMYKGWLDEAQIQKYYKRASIVLILSDYEPFGLVLIEAMVKGCVVIANAVSGPKEIIKSGFNGYLVDKKNTDDLFNLIHNILNNSKEVDQIRNKALQTVINNYNIEKTTEAYLNIYKQCYEN